MKLLTIFTPTYNRAYILHQLYDSLLRQTNESFEWLIIDDGSSDNTKQLVDEWIAEGRLTIRYVYQSNQGMHGAHNTAYELITTELNMCIDSDDYLPEDAVDKIVNFWTNNKSSAVAGFVGLDAYVNGTVIGSLLPEQLQSSSLFDLYYKHGVSGDKKLVYRTELTRQYPYPLFEGERYVGLAYKYYMLDQHYKLLMLNEVLCIVDYLPDGSSLNMFKQYAAHPKGFSFYRQALMKLPSASMGFKYRQAVHYVSSSMFAGSKQIWKELSHPWLVAAAILPGILLHGYIRLKLHSKQLKGKANDYSVG